MKQVKSKIIVVKKEKKRVDKKKKLFYNLDRKDLLNAFQNKSRTVF